MFPRKKSCQEPEVLLEETLYCQSPQSNAVLGLHQPSVSFHNCDLFASTFFLISLLKDISPKPLKGSSPTSRAVVAFLAPVHLRFHFPPNPHDLVSTGLCSFSLSHSICLGNPKLIVELITRDLSALMAAWLSEMIVIFLPLLFLSRFHSTHHSTAWSSAWKLLGKIPIDS